jgi:putative ABC transport system permease protein
MMDNGFVVQNKSFDYLVDMNNHIVNVTDGEIGVPVSYMVTYKLSIGDKVTISDGDFKKEFRIVCFVRDAQMASSMASSTRFLVSKTDHEVLKKSTGSPEYIIEYRFKNETYANDFQKLYQAKNSAMPDNGPAITYPLIKLLNGISSGLLAAILAIVSLLIILVAIVNVRLTIMDTLEKEQKEIGIMKTIGFSNRDIRTIYLSKFRLLAIAGCILGYLLELIMNRWLTSGIVTTFGNSPLTVVDKLIPAATTFFIGMLVISSCKKILKRIEKISAVEALIYGNPEKGNNKIKLKSLKYYKGRLINECYALRECLFQWKSWLLVGIVFLLATVIMIIPINLLNTLQSPEFSSKIGSPQSDIKMGIQFTDGIQEKYQKVKKQLDNITEVSDYGVYATIKYEVDGEEGKEPLLVACGDYNLFPIICIDGKSPTRPGEIALSHLNAKKLNVKVGDNLEIYKGQKKQKLTVCGIYQDVTAGGYTAKTQLNYDANEVLSYTFFVRLNHDFNEDAFMDKYGSRFNFIKVVPMNEFLTQTVGNLISSFYSVAWITSIVAVFISSFMIALFIKLKTVKEYSKCAILKAIGFTRKEIRRQYLLQSILTAFIGIMLGALIAIFFGENLIGAVLAFAGVGLAKFQFVINWLSLLLCPGILLIVSFVTTWQCQSSTKECNIIDLINE